MTITDEIFNAFLKCETKAFLKSSGTLGDHLDWDALQRRLAEEFERRCISDWRSHLEEREYLSGVPFSQALDDTHWRLATDCTVQTPYLQTRLHALERLDPVDATPASGLVPIRFVPNQKITPNDKQMLAFDALVIWTACGSMPPYGKVIHGIRQTSAKVKVNALMPAIRAIIGRIAAQQANETPPQLILNKHCPECEFQTRCHQVAKEKDELSLLSGMSEKERKRYRDKGIFTVTQLSYTFRARRKPKRFASKPDKYNHALKALAIRENKVYVSGRPELKVKGTLVYLDVEGIPDRDFYYLIGLRIKVGDLYQQYSFWANDVSGERDIWISFLQTLAKIENPQLIYYGSYETKFLKQMKMRYSDSIENTALIDTLIEESVNILSIIYAHIYFPTYSNGLKENARYLGFQWVDSDVSGIGALVRRYEWESTRQSQLKDKLVTYNREDCQALERVTAAVAGLSGRASSREATEASGFIQTDSLKREFPFRFGKREFALPELQYINQAAYWDKQRDKVRVREGQLPRQIMLTPRRIAAHDSPVDVVIEMPSASHCPTCSSSDIRKHDVRSRMVYDIRLSSSGINRWIARYVYRRYSCRQCQITFVSPERNWTKTKYGWELVAYTAYQIVDLQIPQSTVTRNLNEVFHFNINHSTLNGFKAQAAEFYGDTYKMILNKIVSGNMIHVDETHVDTHGKSGFIWVITNLEEVAYFYTQTREGIQIKELLKDFKGVLVSDFYAAYDAINCRHQRCLIHLIRDLNEDIQKEPFNSGLQELAQQFGGLVKSIVETIDSFGLKAEHLHHYKADVEQFYVWLYNRTVEDGYASSYKKRFLKYRDQLFTFLEFDGIPWNNNPAENAIKTFARLRRVLAGASTEKGLRDYLTLLSICETCKNRGISFLDFLLSQERDMRGFNERDRLAKRRT